MDSNNFSFKKRMEEVTEANSDINDEGYLELLKRVAILRRKVPKACAEHARDCVRHEIDLRLNAPHEPLVAPDVIKCNLPDEDTKKYMKSLSEKLDNTTDVSQKMANTIKSLEEAAVLYNLKKRSGK